MSTSSAQPDAHGKMEANKLSTPGSMSMFEVLGIKVMRRLWYAQIVSTFGDFLALFAVIGVLAFKLKANPEQITGVQIAYQIPIAVLGILAGVFVDRWPLKRTLVLSDIIRGFLCIGLLFANHIWHYYIVLAAISVVSSFFGPAQGVVIRGAVPLYGLRSSNALMQQVMFMMRIVGPAAAGVMVSSFGYNPCYIIDAASFFASACFIGSLIIKRSDVAPQHTAAEDKGAVAKVWHDMQQGVSFIVHHAALLFVVLAMSIGMFIIGCFGPLIAVYIRDSILPAATLQKQNTIYGLAQAMIGIGMFLGVASLNMFATRVKNTILVYTGLLGIGAGLVFLTVLTFVWSTLAGDFLIGIAVACIIIPAQTLMQQETPPALLGRVGSTFMSSIFTAQILGLLLSGALAKLTGVREVFAICAGVLGLLTLAGKLFMEPKEKI